MSEWRNPAERTMAAWDARCIADGLPTPLEQLHAARAAGDDWLAWKIERSIVRLTGQAVLTAEAAEQLERVEVSYQDFLRSESNLAPAIAKAATRMQERLEATLALLLDQHRPTRYATRRQMLAAWLADNPAVWLAAAGIAAALAFGYLIGSA
jgi:hypothetical protein